MAKQPMVSGLGEPEPPTNNGYTPKRRRYRRCKSAPLEDSVPSNVNNGNVPLPSSKSIFREIHPSFRKVFVLFSVYLGAGTLCFYFVGNQIKGRKTNGVLDSVYFCIVTMTTVGYGDLVPDSSLAKLLACAFVFMGMALVGHILSKAADYLVEKQEILLVKALHMHETVGPVEILKEIQTNRVRYKFFMVLTILVVLIVSGTTFLVTVENLDLVDAFYCVCSTITTLGYGDKSFTTEAGRIFAIFWIVTSTIFLARFFLYIAELNTEHRQKALVKWVLKRRMTNVDLEAADLDGDGEVEVSEFIIYKLKEMGKISQADIAVLMEEFEHLDVDQSGTISISDITIAQSSQREVTIP